IDPKIKTPAKSNFSGRFLSFSVDIPFRGINLRTPKSTKKSLRIPKTQFIRCQQIIHYYLIEQQGPFYIYYMPTVFYHHQGRGTVLLCQLPYGGQEQIIFLPHNIKGRNIDIYRSKKSEQGINFRSE